MNISKLKEIEKIYEIKKADPQTTGFIYFICDEKSEIVYIGKTKYLYSRLSYHSLRSDLKGYSFYYFEISKNKMKKVEKKLIREIKPPYNIQYNHSTKGNIPSEAPVIRNNIREIKRKVGAKKLKKELRENRITQTMIASCLGVTKQAVSLHIRSGYIPESIFKTIEIYKTREKVTLTARDGSIGKWRRNLW